MKAASFLISDISSVVSDFLPTGRPIFLFLPKDRQIRTSASIMPMESYCYVYHDTVSLLAQISRVIVNGDDWLREMRLKARDYFVDSVRTAGLGFEQSLRDLITERETSALAWSSVRPETPVTVALQKPKVIGHRGAKGLWPENSLSGFVEVARMEGLDGVEFDLHLTSDGEIVILHDPLLQRTTTGSGPVSRHCLAEIRDLRLRSGSKDHPEVLDETVPTLDEVLEILRPTGLELHVELKNDALGVPYPGLAEKTLARLHTAGLAGRSILTSFSPEVLEEVRALDRDIPVLASVNYRSMEMLGGAIRCFERFDRIQGCALALDYNLIKPLLEMHPDLIDLHRVGVWVINTDTAIQKAIAQGVRQITTDRPDIVMKFL
jgi:glycerophosphoryl diester phosphodiesterase